MKQIAALYMLLSETHPGPPAMVSSRGRQWREGHSTDLGVA